MPSTTWLDTSQAITRRCPVIIFQCVGPSNVLNVCICLQVVYVESFINSVDSQMHQKQEQQKLAAISARVESYEAVEGASEEVERVRTAYSTNNPLSSLQNKKKTYHCSTVLWTS